MTTSSRDSLREQIRKIWRPLLDKSAHAQEMAYLISLATDETEQLIAKEVREAVKQAHRAKVVSVTTIAKDDPLQEAFDTWVQVNGQRFGIKFDQLSVGGGDE